MNKRKLLLIVAAAAMLLLLLSMGAPYLWGATAANVLRWCGVGLAVVYLILRHKV